MRFPWKWFGVIVLGAVVVFLASGYRSGVHFFPQDNIEAAPVTITFSSPQDPAFVHKVHLEPDSLGPFDSRSTFLMRVPDGVTILEAHVEASTSPTAFTCDSVRFAEGRSGTVQMTEQGNEKFYRVQLPPRWEGETEFYAGNFLLQFCALKYSGLGPNYSKRTYYFGMWYGPEQLLGTRARGTNAVPIEKLEESIYVK